MDFLEDYTEEKGYSPSYREIQAGLGLSSVSAVAEHIDNMVSKGILKKVPEYFGAHRRAQALEHELEEHRITIMLSQIQPHFLYNSLNAMAVTTLIGIPL